MSVYGPLATMEQFAAAKLGGASAARITFWLKLWDSAAFAAVALVLDRLLRHKPAQRLRAHLLWTVNPLLLWDLVAAGHLDVLAVMAGLLGLLMLGEQHAAARPGLWRFAAAGALLGFAADIKIDYVLFGLGAAWALRRSLARSGPGGCGRAGRARAQLRVLRDPCGPGAAQPAQPEQRRHLVPGVPAAQLAS